MGSPLASVNSAPPSWKRPTVTLHSRQATASSIADGCVDLIGATQQHHFVDRTQAAIARPIASGESS